MHFTSTPFKLHAPPIHSLSLNTPHQCAMKSTNYEAPSYVIFSFSWHLLPLPYLHVILSTFTFLSSPQDTQIHHVSHPYKTTTQITFNTDVLHRSLDGDGDHEQKSTKRQLPNVLWPQPIPRREHSQLHRPLRRHSFKNVRGASCSTSFIAASL